MNLRISSVRAENTTITDKKYPDFVFKNNHSQISKTNHRAVVNHTYSFTSNAQELHIRSSLDRMIESASTSQTQPPIAPEEIPLEASIGKKKIEDNMQGISSDINQSEIKLKHQTNKVNQLKEKADNLYYMLTTGDMPTEIWVNFLKSKEKEGVDVFDPASITSLSEKFITQKKEENEQAVNIFNIESKIESAILYSVERLKELHHQLKKSGEELESGLIDKIPEALDINYDTSPSKYDAAFYIYPEIEGGNNSHEFDNDKVFQEIKSKRKKTACSCNKYFSIKYFRREVIE